MILLVQNSGYEVIDTEVSSTTAALLSLFELRLEVIDFVLELLDRLVLRLDEGSAAVSVHPSFLNQVVEVTAEAGPFVFGFFPPFLFVLFRWEEFGSRRVFVECLEALFVVRAG
ncbi:hypothetical protein C452_15120 [Haloferax volcanii JCM 10717]|uniref:Uncharacterized protein n=1 Tax=Haloferax volcanii JCM 10717 TaxID=1227458 RepID=M0HWN7_HALVO|nr:hypothetical protein C452_15120 [Haloferax alexandrinus JCM 10717]